MSCLHLWIKWTCNEVTSPRPYRIQVPTPDRLCVGEVQSCLATFTVFHMIHYKVHVTWNCPLFSWLDNYSWSRQLCCWGFDTTLRHDTLSRTPLDERSARRRELYVITHNTHMFPSGLETAIPSKRTGADPRLRPRGLKLSLVSWIFRSQATSCLGRLVVSILPQRLGFDLRALERVFLCVLRYSPVSIISPLLHDPVSVICYWRCVISAVDT
jgi:hypothetical protein